MSSVYSVLMDCVHATPPEVCWTVRVFDRQGKSTPTPEDSSQLFVPEPSTWTLDTLRMVLHELSAYVPPDADATGGVEARVKTRRGRQSRVQRPSGVDQHVMLWVEARGWRAEVMTWVNYVSIKVGEQNIPRLISDWSEPMAAVLLDLAASSPFRMASVAEVFSAPGYLHNLKPSRRDVVDGYQLPFVQGQTLDGDEADEEIDVRIRRRRRLDFGGGR